MEEGNRSNITLAASLSGSISSAVCLVVITLILLLLIFYKAYTSTLQRLFLYLTIFTVIQEACLTVGYATQFEYSDQETLCNVITIVTMWSAATGYLSVFGVFIYLPYKFYKQIRRDPFSRQLRSKCCHVAMECFFVLVVLALPLIYIWNWDNCTIFAPWQWCSGIIANKSCTAFPEIARDVINLLILVSNSYDLMGMIGVVFTIVLSVVFCCVACKYRETRQPFLKTLCRTLILLGLFVVSTTVTLLVNTLLPSQLAYPDWYYNYQLVNGAVLPVTQIVFPLGFLFYLYSFNLFRWRAIKRAAAEWRCFHRSDVVEEKMYQEYRG